MIKHYIKVALRLIKRSMLFSSINMLGFVFGMAAAFLIYLWVVHELTYDDCFSDANRIYRAIEVRKEASGEIKEIPASIRSLAQTFKNDFPQVEDATSILYEENCFMETENDKKVSADKVSVDTTFFRMFSFPVIEGDPNRISDNVNNIVLTEPIARKLFGNAPAVGRQISRSVLKAFKSQYTVVAVVRIPAKSHIRFDVAVPIDSYMAGVHGWNWDSPCEKLHVYVKMKKGDAGRMDRQGHQSMSQSLHHYGEKHSLLRFQPIGDIYLHTTFSDPLIKNHGSLATIYLFIALAVLIIFMGAFNFTMLSTARASLRYKEIGVRKVTGAKRKTLVRQFLMESLVQAFISLVLALALTELALPLFNRCMDVEVSLTMSWSVIFYILFGIVGVGCLAGSYPAFYLSSINPLLAFKGGFKTGKKGGLIKWLVCVQFVIALVLMLMTSIVFKQLHYIQNKDLGLDKENVVSVYTNLWYGVAEFKQELLRNPNVISVSMGAPIESFEEDAEYGNGRLTRWTDVDGREDSLKMVLLYAEADFVKTFNLKLLKGELLDAEFGNYWGNMTPSVIINEAAWKAMKVADPIGMELQMFDWAKMHVVGVVKDFNFQSLREKIKPAILYYTPENLQYVHIKIAPGHRQETLKFIQQKYEEMAIRDDLFVKEFRYQFFSDALNKNYAKEHQQSRMLLFFTVLAIVIAMMGVFGLVALATEQRTKEIGIRKVNGAHSHRIVMMFCHEYLKWVGIAFIIACPIGYFFMRHWLSEFAYQTSISWWLFLLAGAVIAGITLLAVIGQTWRKASQNPVKSLRYE